MHQILRGTSQLAELEIYWNNELTNADGNVLVTVVDADYPTTTILCTNQTAYNDPLVGKYTFELDPTFTQLNRVLQITWSYTINGKSTFQEDFYDVYTPYAAHVN